jgi:hypothetical protein
MVVLLVVVLAYQLWSTGRSPEPGVHDRGHNGIWLQHGWIGDDLWYERYNKQSLKPTFRDREALDRLAARLRAHHITDLFPHLAPSHDNGELLEPDQVQLELFLDVMHKERVLPWIGGVYQRDVHANLEPWRQTFIQEILGLLTRHPGLSGVHLNIEPWPSGEPHLLVLLEELRERMPQDKVLSVAAYPPPVPMIGNLTVHWTPEYTRLIAERVDHMAFMNYDSGLKLEKLYIALMARWTRQIMESTASTQTQVLLGLPVYDDAGVPWHDPDVEHLNSALKGTHQGLEEVSLEQAPHFQGVSIYADWEMDEQEWHMFASDFVQ